ncbi:MAG: pilus assembly protein [Lachnospiraceae bacterium]|nr:pilus assembly protein [Lachnospiraceae bacterium]
MHTYLLNDSEIPIKTHLIRMVFIHEKDTETNNGKNNVAHQQKTPIKSTTFSIQKFINSILSLFWNYLKPPRYSKYAVQSISDSNRGSATIEAVCVIPILLFVFWAFYSMCQIYMLENQVYQAAMNTADYLAEYAYLAEDTELELLGYGAAQIKLRQYLPKPERVEQYVVGGTYGIIITEPVLLDEDGFVKLHVKYWIKIPVPMLGELSMPIQVQVRQKAYTGYQDSDKSDETIRYVYLTENSVVYHTSRSCTHLDLTVIPVTQSALQTTYAHLSSCEYCGNNNTGHYYVTRTGDCYHTSLQCSGLKRTVRRVPFSQVSGYQPCSRCGE